MGKAQVLQKQGPLLLTSLVVLGKSPNTSGYTTNHTFSVKCKNVCENIVQHHTDVRSYMASPTGKIQTPLLALRSLNNFPEINPPILSSHTSLFC